MYNTHKRLPSNERKDRSSYERKNFRELKRFGSSVPAGNFDRSFIFSEAMASPPGSSFCCKDVHSTLFGAGQRSLGPLSLPFLISDPIIRCRDVVEAWNYGHWHGTVDSPLGDYPATLRLKRRETSRKEMKLSRYERISIHPAQDFDERPFPRFNNFYSLLENLTFAIDSLYKYICVLCQQCNETQLLSLYWQNFETNLNINKAITKYLLQTHI